jgi:hypothetical protein
MLVMNNQINAARDVTKTHTLAIHQFFLRTVDGWSLRVMQGFRFFSGAGSTGGWNEWDRRLGGRDQG